MNKKPQKKIHQAPPKAQKQKEAKNYLPVWLGLIVAITGVILYWNTLNHGFVLDDYSVIKENRVTRMGTQSIPTIFKTSYRNGYYLIDDELYRPIPKALFAWFWQIAPDSPKPGHVTNVLLFGLTGFMLMLTLSQWLKKNLLAAFLAALLFVAHPIHTEVVANIKSIDEILSFLFCISSAWLFYNYLEKSKNLFLLLSIVCYTIALFSKESSITFLVIFPLIAWFFFSGNQKISVSLSIKKSAWLLLPALFFLMVRYNVLKDVPYGNVSVADNLLVAIKSNADRFATAILILGMYLKLLFYPHPLIFDASYNQIPATTVTDLRFILSFLIYAGLLVFAFVFFKKKHVLSFAVLFFLVSLSIYANIFRTIGSSYGERFLYTPSLGICIAVAYLITFIPGFGNNQYHLKVSDFFKTNIKAIALTSLVVILFGFKTVSRNTVWKSNYTLFSNDVKLAPNSTRTQYYLGNLLMKPEILNGKDSLASDSIINSGISYLKKSVEIYPKFCDAYNQLGVAYYKKKDYKSSFDYYTQCISCNPTNASAHSNLGTIYFETKQFDNAINSFAKAIELDRNYAEALLNLGSTYGMLQQYDNALSYLHRAVKADPGLAQGYYFLGITYRFKGDEQNANAYIQKAHQLDPSKY
ncbi:MAG TPA: tetratricopeptide repeat protein [Bacteroidia bacterium]|nr:tetratricopeptide repeat protein [Bacteroidia bacterium]